MKQKQEKAKRESIVLLSPVNKKQCVVRESSSTSSSEYESTSESSDDDLFDIKKKYFKINESDEISEEVDLSSEESLLHFSCFIISDIKSYIHFSYC